MAGRVHKQTVRVATSAPHRLKVLLRGATGRLSLVGKGALIGCAELIPSVSGGTVALMTGIWTQIILALGRFRRDSLAMLVRGDWRCLWRTHNLEMLSLVLVGSLIGLFALARPVHWLLEHQPHMLMALIFGVIVGSTPRMLASLRLSTPLRHLPLLLLGVAMGLFIGLLPPGSTPASLPMIFVSAMIASCAALLPGLSGAYILLIAGVYDEAVRAVAEFDPSILATLAAGVSCGVFAFARVISRLLAWRSISIMLLLVGMVVGSLWKVAPRNMDFSQPWGFSQAAEGGLPVGTGLVLVALGLVAGHLLARGLPGVNEVRTAQP